MTMFPLVHFDAIDLRDCNRLLSKWGHSIGPINRPIGMALSHALYHEGQPVAVTVTSSLIRECVAGRADLGRHNTCELSRLCASRPDLCRVTLRLWREFVWSPMRERFPHAISYQDADRHTGNVYRFDGWENIGKSSSGTDQRSGRKGRNKVIWHWPKTGDATRTVKQERREVRS